jgi:hypothetical protein
VFQAAATTEAISHGRSGNEGSIQIKVLSVANHGQENMITPVFVKLDSWNHGKSIGYRNNYIGASNRVMMVI